MSRFEEFRSSRFGSSRFRLRGFRGAAFTGELPVITASVSPQLGTLTDGETVQSALSADALDAANYSSTEGTITDVSETVTINNTAGALADVVAFGDLVNVTVTVSDAAGNMRDFNAGLQPVQGIAPTLTASDSLSGRTLTITVDSTTGVPAPVTVLTALTLDGVDVLGDETSADPWTYEVPDSADSQTVAWTVETSNAEGSDTVSGSEAVAANLFAPTITSAPQITGTVAPGETVTLVEGTYSGVPAPTITPTLTLDGTNVTGDLVGLDYTIPGGTTVGVTLEYSEVASNGVSPDGTQSVIETVENDAVDADAAAFISARETADGQTLEPAVVAAYDTFYKSMKDAGIYSKRGQILAFVGARTLAGALVPALGPTPTAINFLNGDLTRTGGLKGNAVDKYIQTGYSLPLSLSTDSTHSVIPSVISTSPGGATTLFSNRSTMNSDNMSLVRTDGVIRARNTNVFNDGAFGSDGEYIAISRDTSTTAERTVGGVYTTITRTAQLTDQSFEMFLFRQHLAALHGDARIAYWSSGQHLTRTERQAESAAAKQLISDIEAALA